MRDGGAFGLEEGSMELVVVVLVVLLFDAAALRWGVSTRDSFDSPAWGRGDWPDYGGRP